MGSCFGREIVIYLSYWGTNVSSFRMRCNKHTTVQDIINKSGLSQSSIIGIRLYYNDINNTNALFTDKILEHHTTFIVLEYV